MKTLKLTNSIQGFLFYDILECKQITWEIWDKLTEGKRDIVYTSNGIYPVEILISK
jgi:hypothetical protein